ncbi:MAG TPA: VWA domain-containing protein [Trueperaceae bacterium]|nr:VWA domain-containing protein [Trueperaceae bacterium]
MTFIQPAWLWLLPVALPLVLMLHARRRRDVVVPSLVVWRRVRTESAPAPSRRSFPWRDPLLWLQLLAIALLTLALARPVLGEFGDARWVVLLDASLSMSATDVAPSRFDEARREVERRWGGRGANGTVSLVSVGPSARLVTADWSSGPGLRRALAELQVSAGPADWSGAAARAASLAADGARVAVVTDGFGRGQALEALAAVGIAAEDVAVVSVGAGLVNVGVGGVKVEPRGSRPDQWTVSGRLVTSGFERGDVVRVVAAYRPQGTATFLPWGAEEVAVDADGAGEFAIPLDLPGPGEVQVRGPEGDHLPADDAVVVSLRGEPVRVAVVGEAHPALLRALAAVGDLEAYAVAAVPAPAEAAAFDLVVVTSETPDVPATSTLWLGTVPPGMRAGDPITVEQGGLVAAPHPLTADLDPTAFGVASAVPSRLPAGSSPLLLAGDDVLAWARTTTTGRQVLLGFDLEDSDWTSQVSFPAFVSALVAWAAPRTWSHVPGGCRAGEACGWPREAFAGGWRLLDPDGSVVPGTPTPVAVEGDSLATAVWTGASFDAGFVPDRAGVYMLETATGSVTLPVVTSPLGGEPADAGPARAVGAAASAPRPWRWLALLAATGLGVEAATALARQRRVVRRRWRVPLALTGLALVAVVAAVAGVPLPSYGPAGTMVWVGRDGPPADVAHGRGVNWVRRRAASPQGAGGGHDLASALERALATPRGYGDLRVVVPGQPRDALPVQEAGRLVVAAAARGVRFDVVDEAGDPEAAATAPDSATVEAVALPDRVRAGSRFALRAEVAAPPDAAWRLAVSLVSARADSAGGEAEPPGGPEPTASAEASGVGPGVAVLELQAGGRGELAYRLELLQEGGDGAVDVTSVTVHVGPPPAVMLVATDDQRGAVLASALETQGLSVERATPFGMPGTLERLSDYDAVLLVDVAASEMFPEYQALLERYVRELGGGLAIVGGTSAFGPGGYYATPLEEVSPVSSRITDEAPEVAMAFVLDRSGSMGGLVEGATRMDVAKLAALEAIGLLGEGSLAAVIVFDTEARVVLPLTPVADEDAFRAALATVNPAGGTAIYPGLVAAGELMSASDSATRHVVVLTDGLSQEGDFAGVLRALTDMGVTTTFVGVGDAADRRQLTTLASLSGGTLHMALDFRALPSLLAQEALMLAATPIEEGTFAPRWSAGGVPGFLTDAADGHLPELTGYVRTTSKDEATVHAYADGDDPLLASWRYGLGRVVAFTSDADGRWSQAWTRLDGFARTWAQLVRWVAERPVRDPWSLRLGRRGDALDLVVDVPIEARSASATGLPVVTLVGEGGAVLARRRLEWAGPGRAAASFEVDSADPGELTVALSPAPKLGLTDGVARTVAWPVSPGIASRSDVVPLAILAEATGGAVYRSAAEVPREGRRTLAWRLLPEAWLLVALLVFLTSLAVRYGAVPRRLAGVKVRPAARTRTTSPGP